MSSDDKKRPDRSAAFSADRNFGITFVMFFAIVGFLPLYRSGTVRWWAIALAAAFLFCAFAFPSLLRPLNHLWSKLGLLLHRVISPIVMVALYFIVFTPIGLVLRACDRNFFRLKFDKDAASYWLSREPPAPRPGGMTKQF